MAIAAALCAALTVTISAKAQEVPCSAETAGQLLCQQSRLCQCEYFAGGALSDGSAGYRWDCAVFRPRCEGAAEPQVEAARQPEDLVTPSLTGTIFEATSTTVEAVRLDTMALLRGQGHDFELRQAPALNLVAAEGLDTRLDALRDAGRTTPDEPPAIVAARSKLDTPFDLIAAEGLGPVPGAADASGNPRPANRSVVLAALSRWAQALWSVPRPERRISKAPVPQLGDRFAQQVAQAEQTRIRLEVKIAALQNTLGEERQRIAALEGERNDLELHRARLMQQLQEMGEIQQAALDRLADHTSLEIAVFEETVAMAGLDVAVLLPEERIDGLEDGQGGPFIPERFLVEPDPVEAAEASLSLLDERIERWDRLQELLRSLPLAAPLEQYRISSAFGPRKDPVNGRLSRHFGLDFRAKLSTPVLSTAPGEVVFAAWKGRYGRLVEIDHGHGIRTRYAHLHKILVEKGQQIGHRESIGLLGSSGRSTGPHVHYEVLVDGKPHNPMNFLKAGIHVFKTAEQEDALSGLTKGR
jgi:murein DD-endopeptidase MepM/ murein hydrolase activator NlpD